MLFVNLLLINLFPSEKKKSHEDICDERGTTVTYMNIKSQRSKIIIAV